DVVVLAGEVVRPAAPGAADDVQELTGPRVPLVVRQMITEPALLLGLAAGDVSPGRNATRNFSFFVWVISAAVTSQASSHQVPVGVSTPVKPSCSADLAIWPR